MHEWHFEKFNFGNQAKKVDKEWQSHHTEAAALT